MKKPTLRSTLLAAAIAAAVSGHAYAAGLGRINVLSSLGQPLRAEIEVAATPEELETMSARLASVDAFKRANIEYSGVLNGVRMSIERRGSSAIVRVASDRPVAEPFVDMLVELNWAGGRLLREYTFLLDPPATTEPTAAPAQGTPVPMVPSAPVTALPGTPPVSSGASPRTPVERPAPAPAAQTQAQTKQAAEGEYKVEQGDTLSSIARELKASEVSQEQMLAALYQSNSSAFIGGNINRLRAGRILAVPSADDAKAIAPREARQIILKASDFDGYRQQVADAAKAAPARDADVSQSASGKIAPRVTSPATSAESQDKLKIAKTQVAPAGAAAADPRTAARVQALEEDIASRDKALKESRDRVAALEKNIKELQALVELKNKNLADLQKQAQAAEASAKDAQKKADALAKAGDAQRAADAKAAAAAATKAAADARKAAEDARKAEDLRKQEEAKRLADEKKAAEAKAQEDARLAAEAARAEEERKAAEARQAEEAARLAAEQSAAAAAAAALAASEPVAAEVSAPEVEPAPEVAQPAQPVAPPAAPAPVADAEEDSFFPGGTMGMLLAAVLGLGGLLLLYKRQRRGKSAVMNTTAMSEASTSPNSVFGSAGGQTVDTGTSVLHTDFSQSGLSAIDTDEGVDPVAEADVYMAYGRDAQAEEILLDALKSDPGRAAIYGKLLEIYAQRKSVKQFENIATDLFTQTGGAGDEWAKAAALGQAIDPDNPLYRSGAAAGAVPAVAVAAAAAAAAPVIPELPEEPAAAPEAPQAVTFGTNNVSQMRATWTMPGEINQFTGDGTDLAQQPAVSVATEPEPLNLDFNLDLELPNEEEPQTRMEAHQDEDMLLPLAEQTVEDTAGADAPLEFDLGAMGGAPAAAPAARQEPTPVRAAALSDADLGIERNLVDEDNLAVVDLEKTNFEGNVLDFDFELGEESKGPTASDRSVDLSDIGVRTTGVKPLAPAAPVGNEALPDSIDLNEEVSTKLELARAYEEMGDIEGARELLEEVVADGAMQQKEEARQILTRIG